MSVMKRRAFLITATAIFPLGLRFRKATLSPTAWLQYRLDHDIPVERETIHLSHRVYLNAGPQRNIVRNCHLVASAIDPIVAEYRDGARYQFYGNFFELAEQYQSPYLGFHGQIRIEQATERGQG